MLRLGLATAPYLPQGVPDDQLVLPYLAQHGIEAVFVNWAEPLPAELDALIMRSTWSYFEIFEAFAAWIEQLKTLRIPVANPPARMQQNLSKRYLLELQAAGFATVPTRLIDADAPFGPAQLAQALDHAPELVLKPVISAAGHATYRVRDPDDLKPDDWCLLRQAQARDGLLLQPFVPQIQSQGEWSLVFFGGHYSHAVNKRAAADQFLIHEEYGGQSTGQSAPADLQSLAEAVVARFAPDCLYARVDAIWHQEQWQVMELELIEPALYLAQDPAAPARWAEAIARWLAAERPQRAA
ncbi:MAG: hypothetical protein IGS03_03200 [Candidatus Sericytochromatia bacterium]|nr:hypothetical protein [Candidatus Sericytochromatia bacterium]